MSSYKTSKRHIWRAYGGNIFSLAVYLFSFVHEFINNANQVFKRLNPITIYKTILGALALKSL